MGNTAAAPAQQEAWGPLLPGAPRPRPSPTPSPETFTPRPQSQSLRRHTLREALTSVLPPLQTEVGGPQGVKDWSTPTLPGSLPCPVGLQRLGGLMGSFPAWPACALGEAGVLGFLLRGLPAGEATSADFSPTRGD